MNKKYINIAIVGKYAHSNKGSLKVEKALKRAAKYQNIIININWINAKTVTSDNINDLLKDMRGILIPGGFGYSGVEGMIIAIKYARENDIPLFGICLGMQLAVIEYARNVIGLNKATSGEFDKKSSYKVVDRIPDLPEGNLLEGFLPCVLKAGSLIEKCYQSLDIDETFRHGYTVNNDYCGLLENKGLVISALSADGKLVEAIELTNHQFFLSVQFHPELSCPEKPHPLFLGFIEAVFKKS